MGGSGGIGLSTLDADPDARGDLADLLPGGGVDLDAVLHALGAGNAHGLAGDEDGQRRIGRLRRFDVGDERVDLGFDEGAAGNPLGMLN